MKTVTSLVVALAISLALPTAPASAQVFSNEEQSCALYGRWAVEEMRKAERLGCNFPNARQDFDVSRHVNWCMGQSDATMRAQATTHRNNVAAICGRQGIDVRGGPQPAAASALPSFSNEEQSCALYGNWAVGLMRRADAMGCDFDNARDWFTPQRHLNWCMGQSAAAMRNQAQTHWNNMISRCSRRGVDFVARISAPTPAPAPVAAPVPAPALPSFSNEEQSCALYGEWAVGLMRRADSMGCDFDNARDWFTARRHLTWCMGQSAATMRSQAQTHWNNMVSRCARRGVTFTR